MGCIFNLTLELTGFSFCFAFNQSTEVSFRNCQDFPHPWVQTSPLWGPCGIGEDELGVLQVSTDPSLRQRVTSCPVKGRVTGFETARKQEILEVAVYSHRIWLSNPNSAIPLTPKYKFRSSSKTVIEGRITQQTQISGHFHTAKSLLLSAKGTNDVTTNEMESPSPPWSWLLGSE